ncbi:MAG: penicillin-binding protein 1A [Chromatiales bacterium]|nr:penicillin-binding protein 1A [Chromatiales bacterium]
MKLMSRLLAVLSGFIASLALLSVIGLAGAWIYLQPGLPSADTIRDVRLQVPLRVYSRDGRLMAQLGEMRRSPVTFEEIPPIVIQAFLAAEDERFFSHPGFDFQGIARAALNLIRTGDRSQGGSTITQQLARAYFLTPERSFVRKAREIMLAIQIEQEFSKEEILTLYLNKIFLGQRAYGIAAAAEVYFGKPLDQLSIPEVAILAGLPKAPSVLNPVSNPTRARERRAYVLRRMHELRVIDDAEYAAALATPVQARLHGPRIELDAPYVTEMVRAEMLARFGDEAYTAGYRVVASVDSRLQRAANQALRGALLDYDRRHGYRGPVASGLLESLPVDLADEQAWESVVRGYPRLPGMLPALVTTVEASHAAIWVRDTGLLSLDLDQLRWRRFVNDNQVGPAPQTVADMVAPGDLVYLRRDADGWRLTQPPAIQGAFVALDPQDGAILALAGGYDFFTSSFNRAVQARRQPGSAFKPFIYSAALEHGFTPATMVNDAPVVFDDPGLEAAWRPENNSRRFYGPTRLREALVRSLNLVSVRILLETGLQPTLDHIRPFGFAPAALPPGPSLALGSGGATPLEMTAGYAAFANGGFRVEPYVIDLVVDAEGEIVYRAEPRYVCPRCETEQPPEPQRLFAAAGISLIDAPERDNDDSGLPDAEAAGEAGLWAERIISPENAYLIYDMLRDVITSGTGRRARALGRSDLAGKTGTSNDRRDTWFSGFNGEIVATAWVGFDQERNLGNGEEGGRTALPMWISFMEEALRDAPERRLPRPSGIVTARVSAETGRLASSGEPDAVFELFREADIARLQPARRAGDMQPERRAPASRPDSEIF